MFITINFRKAWVGKYFLGDGLPCRGSFQFPMKTLGQCDKNVLAKFGPKQTKSIQIFGIFLCHKHNWTNYNNQLGSFSEIKIVLVLYCKMKAENYQLPLRLRPNKWRPRNCNKTTNGMFNNYFRTQLMLNFKCLIWDFRVIQHQT